MNSMTIKYKIIGNYLKIFVHDSVKIYTIRESVNLNLD